MSLIRSLFRLGLSRKQTEKHAVAIQEDNLKRLDKAAQDAARRRRLLKIDSGATMRLSLAIGADKRAR